MVKITTMKLSSEGKINEDGIISSSEMITEKEGYEAMLYMLKAYWEATGSTDLTGNNGETDPPKTAQSDPPVTVYTDPPVTVQSDPPKEVRI
jgi:hypothetical protein